MPTDACPNPDADLDAAFAQLRTSAAGLSTFEAQRRLTAQPARLPRRAGVRLAKHAFIQCADPAHLLLLVCALAATLMGSAPVAVAVVVLTAARVLLLAAIQTLGQLTHEALTQARACNARVRRDGRTHTLPAAQLVAGDVVELTAGAQVPADVRLFEAEGLVIDETAVDADVRRSCTMAWSHRWVTRGRGLGLVVAAGEQAAGDAAERIALTAAQDEGSTTPPQPLLRFTMSNALVLLCALSVFLGWWWHGGALMHGALAALVLLALAWSAHERLALPLQALARTHGLRRMMALGVFVRDESQLLRLADVPAHTDAPMNPVAQPVRTISTAGTDDTDHARLAADVVFNVASAAIAPLALRAAQLARSAEASAVRVASFGAASLLALLAVTVLQAFIASTAWPASVPLALHAVVLALMATLALLPVRGAAARGRSALTDPRLRRNLWVIHCVWAATLTVAALLALRGAPRFEAHPSSAVLLCFVLASVALAWLAALIGGGAGWRPRRVVAARAADALRLAPVSAAIVALLVAALHHAGLQSALGLVALPPKAWQAAAALSLVLVGGVLGAALLLEPTRAGPRAVALSWIALIALASLVPPGHATTTRPALSVTVTTAQKLQWPKVLAANGNIAAWQEVVIGAEISNYRLLEVRAQVGDTVRKGQVLAQIQSDTLAAELAQSEALRAEAQAQLAEAKANADRARSLQPTGALSAQQINQLLTAEQTAAARLHSAQAKVRVDALRLAQTRVLAPDDGLISARSATVGSLTQPGQELFRLIRGGRLEWRAEVTAVELARIQPGQLAWVVAPDGARVQGRVRIVAPTVDAQSRTGLVYVDLTDTQRPPATASGVRAGMFVRGEFELGESSALTLPQSAVLLREGFSFVFVVEADDRVTQKKVSVGRRRGERIEITAGLEPNARVVASGAGFLADGDRVRVVSAP